MENDSEEESERIFNINPNEINSTLTSGVISFQIQGQIKAYLKQPKETKVKSK